MKWFLVRVTFATVIVLLAGTLAPAARAQQGDQDPAPTAPRKSDSAAVPAQNQASQNQNDAQMPASGAATTEEARSFTGTIVKENGDVVLKDPVTKVIYKLDDAAKAKPYLGKRVKITGKLDMDSNTIRVESIEMIS
jgi:hypothetical protein